MKLALRMALVGLVGGLIAIQLIPIERTNPPVVNEPAWPAEVGAVVRRSCYDCHSNETDWPWYAHVAPVSWLVARDVREGREEVNFSEWPALDLEAEALLADAMREEVEAGRMPLRKYRWLHGDAGLTDAEKQAIYDWARELEASAMDITESF